MFSRIHPNIGFRQQIHHDRPIWTRDIISKRRSLLLVRIAQVVAVATLGFLFCLWLGVLKDHTPRPSYPYYDTQGPVPPWGEPAPLAGNCNRKAENK